MRKQNVVVEYHDGPEWWVLWPDGTINVFDTDTAALGEIKRRAKRGNRSVTVTTISWRNVPETFKVQQ